MSAEAACFTPDTKLPDVARMMVECDCGEIPVCGIVSQADIARHMSKKEAGELVRQVSERTTEPSHVAHA